MVVSITGKHPRGRGCRQSATSEAHGHNKELSSVPQDYEVPPGLGAGGNSTYSFLRLEPNYVLHMNTKYSLHSFDVH